MSNTHQIPTHNIGEVGMSVTDFITYFAINRATFHRLINAGAIKTIRMGRKHIIPAPEVRRILEEGASMKSVS